MNMGKILRMTAGFCLCLPIALSAQLGQKNGAPDPREQLEDGIVSLYFDSLSSTAKVVYANDTLHAFKRIHDLDISGQVPSDLFRVALNEEERALLDQAFAQEGNDRRLFPFDQVREGREGRSIRPPPYPGAEEAEWVAFSRVTFNADNTLACFYAENVCGGLCGAGYVFIIKRVGSSWTTVKQTMIWIA
jgi:hypothetical protein